MKYNLRCQYCGTDHYVNYYWLMLRLIVFKEVRSQCKACMRQSRYRLIGHIVHDADNHEKQFNKSIDEHKEMNKVWVK